MALALTDIEPQPQGAILARLSEKEDERKLMTVARQEEDQEVHAHRMGIPIVLRYAERGVSGFKEVKRDTFEQLLRDIKAGRITHLFLREMERTTRDIEHGGALLKAAEHAGLTFVINGRCLTMEDNDFELTMMLVMGNMESRKIRRRVNGGNNKKLQLGIYNGGRRPFGFRRVPRTMNGFYEQVPKEAKAIEDGYEMIVEHGRSLAAVAREWNRRGITTSGGVKWNANKVQRVLEGATTAGLQTHKRQIVGPLRLPDGEPWPYILSADEQRLLRSALVSRARHFPGTKPKQPGLLTGLLRCPHCDSAMTIHRAKDASKSFYACRGHGGTCGGCSIRQLSVEAHIIAVAMTELSRKSVRNAIAKPTSKRQRQGEDPRAIEAEMAELEEAMSSPKPPTMRAYLAAQDALQRRLEAAYDALHEDDWRRVLVPFARGDVADVWGSMPLDRQRIVLASLIDRVVVQPAYGRAVPVEERIPPTAITWRL